MRLDSLRSNEDFFTRTFEKIKHTKVNETWNGIYPELAYQVRVKFKDFES